MNSFGCMPAVRTPEASRTLTMPHPGILPSPLRDKVGVFDHDRFRGYVSVHFRSGLHPPCLRFAAAVAGHHARLGTRLLVRLCRGRPSRQLNFMRLQGATPHRSGLARLRHPAPTSGPAAIASRRSAHALAPGTRFPGSESGACFAGPCSPWSPPFAPLPPPPVTRLCSAASLLLWRSQTSHARASPATAPRLPDAGQKRQAASGQA